MPVSLKAITHLTPIPGIRLASTASGERYSGRDDLTVIELIPGTLASAVFTRNAFCAAPVVVAKEHRAAGAPRYALVNAGNANAGNGAPGLKAAQACCAAVGTTFGCAPVQVLPFSTGVIGEPLKVDKIAAVLPGMKDKLAADGWIAAANAIGTTDTVAKGHSVTATVDGRAFSVTGIVKGAGMICPDMATLLVFLGTDIKAEQGLLDRCLRNAANQSFNRITVDGDTSTNDACVLFATGQSDCPRIDSLDSAVATAFSAALDEVCKALAQAVIRDAEGASKFITIEIAGGRSQSECLAVGYAIAHSPLVKTAFFASDPNWGRILAAIGRAGLSELEVDKIRIDLNQVCIVEGGGRCAGYTEAQGQGAMNEAEIKIAVALGRGGAHETLWTSDLSHDYVRINAEYRS